VVRFPSYYRSCQSTAAHIHYTVLLLATSNDSRLQNGIVHTYTNSKQQGYHMAKQCAFRRRQVKWDLSMVQLVYTSEVKQTNGWRDRHGTPRHCLIAPPHYHGHKTCGNTTSPYHTHNCFMDIIQANQQ